MVVGGLEELPGGVHCVMAASNERHRHRLGELELPHQFPDLPVVEGLERERLDGLFLHTPKLGRRKDGIAPLRRAEDADEGGGVPLRPSWGAERGLLQ